MACLAVARLAAPLLLACWSAAAVEDAGAHFEARARAAELQSEIEKAPKSKDCKDEKICKSLGKALWLPGETECRYPAAELCPRRCRRCHQVSAASKCQLHSAAITPPFDKPQVDWGKFFSGMLARAEGLAHEGGGRMLSNGTLWAAEFPHFFSEAEADRLFAIAQQLRPEAENDLPHHIRNVNKIDCEAQECLLDPLVGEVYRRISKLVALPMGNFESLEFLRYNKGQHYVPHTDSDMAKFERQDSETFKSGPRIMTVFLYFSAPEEGGETRFPKAGLEVKPTKGKAVVWANVKPENWWATTPWSEHESVPVKKGLKMAANFWVHPLEYRLPAYYSHHCYDDGGDDQD